MNTLLLCGSLAQKSHTRALLDHLGELLTAKGHTASLWDLKDSPLPFVSPEYHQDPTQNPDQSVQKFVAAVDHTDVIILGSPLYHGSYSGVLKNALDHLRGDAFADKWIALVGNAGGSRASHVEFPHLRQVVNTLGGYCAQTQIGTNKTDYSETPSGYILRDQTMLDRCGRLITELLAIHS